MIDLYKRLGIGDESVADAIRAALPAADPQTRQAAESILLDPRRRPVYDRNRRLLVTVGQLRAHLGLNFTRFWSRHQFTDFRYVLEPEAGAAPPAIKPPVDPLAVLRAFSPRGARHRRPRRQDSWPATAIIVLLALITVLATLWYWIRR